MKKVFKLFILVFIFGIIATFLFSSDLFDIKNIYVNGNKSISKDEIIKLSNIQYNQNIFRLNIKKIIRNLFQNPKIKAVRIKRILPSSVVLDIIEREGIALIPYLGSYINIDDEAVIIEVTSLDYKYNLPIVEGIVFRDFKIGEKLETENQEQLSRIIDLLRYLEKLEISEQIETIYAEDTSNIIMTTKDNVRFYLGNNNLDYKVRMAKAIMDDLINKNETGIVDMRHEGSPIFKRD